MSFNCGAIIIFNQNFNTKGIQMKIKVRIALIVALLVSAMFVAPSIAAGNKDTNFLFVLSSADSNKVTRCFQFAKIAHSKGYKVDIFLIDDAVIWAIPEKANGIKALTGDTAGKYLDYLVQNNVPIGV